MFTLKNITLAAVCISILSVSCAPKKNAKQNIRGRTARGASAVNPNGGQNSTILANARYGDVTGVDQNFSYAVYALAQGVVGGSSDQQIGNVSPQPSNGRGVYFKLAGINWNSGNISSGHLLIEIWDDIAGTIGSDGKAIPPVELYIAPGAVGFQSVTGQNVGGQMTITFTSSYENVTLQGYIQGNEFVGTMSFSNSYASGMTLGQFRVPIM